MKAFLIQFWENYSDREMDKAVRENLAIRWFCGFNLTEHTPDRTYFSKLQKRLGTKRLFCYPNFNSSILFVIMIGNALF